jgi:uracil-DNA glycosylase
MSPVMLIGQAPGPKEIEVHRPFAWTAGKTLFGWFSLIGLDEDAFRARVYMAAVCRCFPGKSPRGGDRLPSREEIANCGRWLQRELQLLRPRLILPVGKLAINQFLPVTKLDEVVGRRYSTNMEGFTADLIPLPHPSGASTWHRTEPGKSLLQQALDLVAAHPAWREVAR